MAFGRTLDAEDSQDIHEKLGDPTVTSIRFIDTGERSYDHTSAECTRQDGTTFVIAQGDPRFFDVYEVVNELDLPWTYHDTFFVDLVMPQQWTVESEVEVTATQIVTAYTEKEAREVAENEGSDTATFAWDYSNWRITSVKSDA